MSCLCPCICPSKKLVIDQEHGGWDEKCCPSFWNDTGVPPIPVLNWVFHPSNKYLNDNAIMWRFGGIGYRYCDARRKEFMGTALAVTVVAMVVAIWGSLSLSSDDGTLRITAWGTAWVKNQTDTTAIKYYLSLTKVVVDECSDATGTRSANWDCKHLENEKWEGVNRGTVAGTGFPWESLKECKAQAEGNQLGALTTTVTLIFALNGCLTRMRRKADTNFQKLLACVPDTYGAVGLGLTLANFFLSCYWNMPHEVHGEPVNYTVGPAYVAYSLVWLFGVLRCLLSWLTPIPGKGCNNRCCVVRDPENTKQLKNKIKSVLTMKRGGSFRGMQVGPAASSPPSAAPAWGNSAAQAGASPAAPQGAPQGVALGLALDSRAGPSPPPSALLLPPGWTEVFSATHQRRYFYHTPSKTTTWLQPVPPPLAGTGAGPGTDRGADAGTVVAAAGDSKPPLTDARQRVSLPPIRLAAVAPSDWQSDWPGDARAGALASLHLKPRGHPWGQPWEQPREKPLASASADSRRAAPSSSGAHGFGLFG